MPADPGLDLERLYSAAALETARGSKSFFFATRFFPRPLAQSAHAVYWFCRHSDDLVDEAPDLATGRAQFDEWCRMVEDVLLRGKPSRHPVLRLFADASQRHSIPSQYPLELLEGLRMDLDCRRYANFAELRVFCYRVASVVGLMMSHVIGYSAPVALEHAVDLGIAMQLTNILRDIREDLQRGRVYLPAEEMACFGCSEADLASYRPTKEFVALMQFQVARARLYYEQAMPGIDMLQPEGRFAVQIAADVYKEILSRIEAADYDVFSRRAVVPASRKYWLTARSMTIPAIRHSLHLLPFWKS